MRSTMYAVPTSSDLLNSVHVSFCGFLSFLLFLRSIENSCPWHFAYSLWLWTHICPRFQLWIMVRKGPYDAADAKPTSTRSDDCVDFGVLNIKLTCPPKKKKIGCFVYWWRSPLSVQFLWLPNSGYVYSPLLLLTTAFSTRVLFLQLGS